MSVKIDLVEMFNAGAFSEGAMAALSELARERGEWIPTPLIEAVLASDPYQAVSLALAEDPDGQDSWGMRPLAWAAIMASPRAQEVAGELLAAGADPAALGALGMGALHWAAKGDCAFIDNLVAAAPRSLDATDARGRSPLACALEEGSARSAAALVRAGADHAFDTPIVSEAGRLWSMPCLAVALELCSKRLREAGNWGFGLDPTRPSAQAAAAMAKADQAQNLAEALLRAGARPDESASHLGSPSTFYPTGRMEMPCWGKFFQSFRHLAKTAMVERAFGSLSESLIAAGMSMDAVDFDGRSPLHHAAMAGRVDLCEKLVKLGADPGLRDEMNDRPEACAREVGHQCLGDQLRSWRERVEIAQALPAPVAKRPAVPVMRL